MRTTRNAVGVALSLALLASPVQALTPVGEVERFNNASPIAPEWQAFEAELGDVHWTYALDYAFAYGLIDAGASEPEQTEAAIDVMRTIVQAPLNADATWGRDGIFPTFIAGNTYYLPVVTTPPSAALTPAEREAAVAYFADLRAEVQKEIEEFKADLAALDLDILRRDVVAAANFAARLETLESRRVGLTAEEAEQLATANRFVELLQDGNFDEVAELQKAIQSLIDKAIATERGARVAADEALGGRVDAVETEVAEATAALEALTADDGVIDQRVSEVVDGLADRLFDEQGNLIVPETDVLGILAEAGLVEDGQLVIDLEGHPALEPLEQLFDANGNPLFVSTEEFEKLTQGLGPLATLPLGVLLLGLVGLIVLAAVGLLLFFRKGLGDLKAHIIGLESQVQQHSNDIAELKDLALADLEWHPANPSKDTLRDLEPGVEHAVTWRVRRRGTHNWCVVHIGREADTPNDKVFTDLKRKRGDVDPINTPFSLQGNRLELSILRAIKREALEPSVEVGSHPAAA